MKLDERRDGLVPVAAPAVLAERVRLVDEEHAAERGRHDVPDARRCAAQIFRYERCAVRLDEFIRVLYHSGGAEDFADYPRDGRLASAGTSAENHVQA